jgi:hypothetical protein
MQNPRGGSKLEVGVRNPISSGWEGAALLARQVKADLSRSYEEQLSTKSSRRVCKRIGVGQPRTSRRVSTLTAQLMPPSRLTDEEKANHSKNSRDAYFYISVVSETSDPPFRIEQ